MTEWQLRKKYVQTAQTYLGAKQGSDKHREIVDIYNSYLPHPRGYTLTTKDPWCAAFDSAIAISCDLTDIIPVECSCNTQISLFQQKGRWEERDDYVPKTGDLIYYDWQDNGKDDDTGEADHVGIVVNAVDDDILVIEGNKGSSHIVGYRHVAVNGVDIRGFGLPDFASLVPSYDCTITLPILQYGATGESVRALQALLNLRAKSKLKTDSSFGPATLDAVRAFQLEQRIDVDGSVGPVTWKKIITLD